jgi:hypothetical protein
MMGKDAGGGVGEPVYEVVWPLGPRSTGLDRLPPRLDDLNGKVIGELWNSVYKGDIAFPVIRAELKKRYPDIRFVEWTEFGDTHGPDADTVVANIPNMIRERGIDAVISGVGHCGSCTPAALRGAFAAERVGIPGVSLVGKLFEPMAHHVSRVMGIENPPLAVYPGRINDDDDDVFRQKVRDSWVPQIIEALTKSEPKPTRATNEPSPRDIVARGTLDEIDAYFYERQWTDGLPITPPTIDRVERFLEYTDRDPNEVIATLLPDARQATVWNVAVTGVMAGCEPRFMPVLLAAVEAISDPAFRLEDAGSGPAWEPMLVVSGPIIKDLEFNVDAGVKRVGRKANTAIGRFLRLFIRNIAGQRISPSDTDRGGIGNNFHVVLAENEDVVRSLGWPTFGEDAGVPSGRSGVTVQSVMAESAPYGDHGGPSRDPQTYLKPLVEFFGKGMLGDWVWHGLAMVSWHPLIVLSPHCASVLAEHGWTKDKVREYLFQEARVPARDIITKGKYTQLDIEALARRGLIPQDFVQSTDPDRLIPTIVRPEWVRFVVAGNPGMYWQRGYMSHGHGSSVTKVVQAAPAAKRNWAAA